jgi:hypothetical protein
MVKKNFEKKNFEKKNFEKIILEKFEKKILEKKIYFIKLLLKIYKLNQVLIESFARFTMCLCSRVANLSVLQTKG